MKRFKTFLVLGIFLIFCSTAWADIPNLINFQGILDSSGNPLANRTVSVEFKIYAVPAGGALFWSETQSVTTNAGGVFNVLLGSSNPIPDSAFDDTLRWLGIKVGTDAEMAPRQQIVSNAYGYRVSTVDGATGGVISGDVDIQSDLTVSGKATIGPGHTNTGVYAFVAGENNTASGDDATIAGGQFNTASGTLGSTVCGGSNNQATGSFATVGGGQNNLANNTNATVGGGNFNNASGVLATVGGGGADTASGGGATVGGGQNNKASAAYSTVSGGLNNIVSGNGSTIGGGTGNTADEFSTTVGGGRANKAHGTFSVIGGGGGFSAGDSNSAQGSSATIGGGRGNVVIGLLATVGGGFFNRAGGERATVGGGGEDTASGYSATVPGGSKNKASGSHSFAAGFRAKAIHEGAFVWADAAGADFASTGANQFLIRASGGVGIGTSNFPALPFPVPLHVTSFRLDTGGVSIGGSGNSEILYLYADTTNNYGGIQVKRSNVAFDNLVLQEQGGNVGIGTTSPSHPLHMGSGAHCTAAGVWTNASSKAFKIDIQALRDSEYSDILEKLEQIEVVRFKYKVEPTKEHIGLIAEDVPDEIASDDRTGIPTADAIGFLMAALKAQQNQIEIQQTQIKKLEETVNQLKKEE